MMRPEPKSLSAIQALTPGCQACGLCTTQSPLLAPLIASPVVCVGLSAKPSKLSTPLDTHTNSGKVISMLEQLCGFLFYKTNLVKCAPTQHGKLRYPTAKEIQCCAPHLKGEIAAVQPQIVLMLGKQTINGIAAARHFSPPEFYKSVQHHGITYLAMPHPSYLWIYRQKQLPIILDTIARIITQVITDAG